METVIAQVMVVTPHPDDAEYGVAAVLLERLPAG
jgi:LmbE family N-acetylglucosaminyl deacetylase